MTQVATGAGLVPAAKTAPLDADLGVRLAKATLPHIDKLLTDAHTTQGPALAWRLLLTPADAEAKALLDKLLARVKAWEKVLAGFLEDPELPPDLVEQFKEEG